MCLSFLPTNGLASFPGLPRFFCSSVSVDNNTRMRKGGEKRGRAAKNAEVFHVFRRPSTSVYYCQRKPKNRKNGVGLGTRLPMVSTQFSELLASHLKVAKG